MAGMPADDHADRRPPEPDDQGDAGSVDQAAEYVAVEVVGPEQVSPAGPAFWGAA
jgi:hypothetical protein